MRGFRLAFVRKDVPAREVAGDVERRQHDDKMLGSGGRDDAVDRIGIAVREFNQPRALAFLEHHRHDSVSNSDRRANV
jgi:hypothetical protein